jgi:hypothetical protein
VPVKTLRRVALAGAFIALLGACQPRRPIGSPNAHVAQGELYKPGLVAYDEFFASVYSLQVEVAGVGDDRRAARSSLTQSLGLLPNVPPERVVEALRERATEVKKHNVRIAVNGTSATAEGKSAQEARPLAQALTSCLAGERSIADRMGKIPERSEALSQHISSLDASVDADFPSSQRSQVKSELVAARGVLAQLAQQSRTLGRASDQYIEDLTRAATLGAHGAAPSPTSKPPAPKKQAPKPAGDAPKPAGDAPPPPDATAPPPPPPKKPAGDDFNP